MRATIAKCESCGGALRVPMGATTLECSYCGVTSVLAASGASAAMPALRVDPAAPIESNAGGAAIMSVSLGLVAILMAVGALTDQENNLGLAVGAGAMALFSLLAAGALVHELRKKAEHQWFRDNGIPARATVQRISAAAQDHAASLGLEIEVSGQAPRTLEHQTTIPPLLVPRLVQGLKLPLIVHPQDPSRVEVQWHLV